MSTEAALFPGFEPPPPAPLMSVGQRLTARQAFDISVGRHPLWGGSLHPLASRHRDSTAPKSDPFTCGSCWFREVFRYHGKTYPKCVYGATNERCAQKVTHGASTDVRAWWPACPNYSPGGSLSSDAAGSIPAPEDN